jgi:hypothetical protein
MAKARKLKNLQDAHKNAIAKKLKNKGKDRFSSTKKLCLKKGLIGVPWIISIQLSQPRSRKKTLFGTLCHHSLFVWLVGWLVGFN